MIQAVIIKADTTNFMQQGSDQGIDSHNRQGYNDVVDGSWFQCTLMIVEEVWNTVSQASKLTSSDQISSTITAASIAIYHAFHPPIRSFDVISLSHAVFFQYLFSGVFGLQDM